MAFLPSLGDIFVIVVAWRAAKSNLAGWLLIFGYTTVEAVVLAWLFSWSIKGPTEIGLYAAAVLVAAAYNLLTCDWLAEKLEP